MSIVSGVEGLKYGINLAGWILVIGLTASAIAGVGFVLAGGGLGIVGRLFGGFIFLIGGLVFVSGLMGILYKVIADGIYRGLE